MLRLISVGIPMAFIASAAGGIFMYSRLTAERTEWARADYYRALEGNVAAQVRMAHCYRVGCSYAAPDPVYACAWYQVIAKEGQTSTVARDEREACGAVNGWDRRYISVAVSEIDRELKREAPAPSGHASSG
jgi:hypothetical protein